MPELRSAITLKGQRVERRDHLFVPQFKALVPCAPYDDHFVFYTEEQLSSAFMCTCGSPAVVVTPEDGTILLVCLFHATNQIHATGGTRWV